MEVKFKRPYDSYSTVRLARLAIVLFILGTNCCEGETHLPKALVEETPRRLGYGKHGARALCVVSRSRDEHANLLEFVEHYIAEGFDQILILDDRSDPPVSIDLPPVLVVSIDGAEDSDDGRNQHDLINLAVSQHLSHCRWVASMDVDEFLTTRANLHLTVRQELDQSFSNTSVIHVPWLQFESHDRSLKSSSMRDGMLWRWNQSTLHNWDRFNDSNPRLWLTGKSIVKPILNPRFCRLTTVHTAACSTQGSTFASTKFISRFANLSETQIPETKFAVHHYRYKDNEDVHRKCNFAGTGRAGGYHILKPRDCEQKLALYWHPEIYDPTMLVKQGKTIPVLGEKEKAVKEGKRLVLECSFSAGKCSNGKEKPIDGKPVARVAIGLYGLFRHDCGSINFDATFKEPLTRSKMFTYVVDVFAHVNVATHAEDSNRDAELAHWRRDSMKKVDGVGAGGADANIRAVDKTGPPDPCIFGKYKPCAYQTEDQDSVDMSIEPFLEKTCYKVGDFWETKSKAEKVSTDCNTTKNYFRALHSQKGAAALISKHEAEHAFKYDVVAIVRPDVVFMRPMKCEHFDAVVHQSLTEVQVLYSPNWANFDAQRGQAGYNDRFLLGHPDAVKYVMRRLDYVEAHVAALEFKNEVMPNPTPKDYMIHAESFMRWSVDRYAQTLREKGANLNVRIIDDFYFRRIRTTGLFVPENQYGGVRAVDVWTACPRYILAMPFSIANNSAVVALQQQVFDQQVLLQQAAAASVPPTALDSAAAAKPSLPSTALKASLTKKPAAKAAVSSKAAAAAAKPSLPSTALKGSPTKKPAAKAAVSSKAAAAAAKPSLPSTALKGSPTKKPAAKAAVSSKVAAAATPTQLAGSSAQALAATASTTAIKGEKEKSTHNTAAKREAAKFILPGIQNEPSTENRFIFFHSRKTGGSNIRMEIAKEIAKNYKGKMKMLVPCNERILGNVMLSVTKLQPYHSYQDKPMMTDSEETELKTFEKLFKSPEMTLRMDNAKPGGKPANGTKIKILGTRHLISCRTYSFKPPGLTQDLLDQVAVFAGHFRWTNIRHLKTPKEPKGPKISCLILVREPISRFRSCYHERLQRESFGGRDLGTLNQTDLHAAIHTRFSTTSVDGMCANEISRWLAPYNGSDAVPNDGLLSEEALRETKSRIAQCVVVNVIENCQEAELVTKHWFPWLSNINNMCKNSGHATSNKVKKSEVALTEEASDMLSAALEQEQVLYDFAMARGALLAEEYQRFVATEEGQRYTAKMAIKAEEAKNNQSYIRRWHTQKKQARKK